MTLIRLFKLNLILRINIVKLTLTAKSRTNIMRQSISTDSVTPHGNSTGSSFVRRSEVLDREDGLSKNANAWIIKMIAYINLQRVA